MIMINMDSLEKQKLKVMINLMSMMVKLMQILNLMEQEI